MTDWYVGMKVVAVADADFWRGVRWTHRFKMWRNGIKFPVKRHVYTVKGVSPCRNWIGLQLHEINGDWWHNSGGFRPVVRQNADISIFTSILDRVNNHEVVDA